MSGAGGTRAAQLLQGLNKFIEAPTGNEVTAANAVEYAGRAQTALSLAQEAAEAVRAEAASAKPTTYKNGGVFSDYVGATPKYATGEPRKDDYKNTMARLYVIGSHTKGKTSSRTRQELLTQALPSDDDRTKGLAQKAVLGTVAKDGALVTQSGATGTEGTGYVEFILQSATHNHVEKIDVVETLADRYVAYAFGNAPPSYSYTLALLNNKQDDQAANMFRVYWNLLRAYANAMHQMEVYFSYDNMIVAGTVTNFSWTLIAQDESYCQANMTLLARKLLYTPAPEYDAFSGTLPTSDLKNNTNIAKTIDPKVRYSGRLRYTLP